MRVKWAPFCNFRGPFFKKGEKRRKGGIQKVFELEHSGQLKKPEHELEQSTGCLSGEIMSQTKKRKAIETVRGYKSSM